jgi:hypothetical protein
MSLKGLECQVSKFVDSDACPRQVRGAGGAGRGAGPGLTVLLARGLHAQAQSEKDARLAQKLGQHQPFMTVFPLECMGQLAPFGQSNIFLAQVARWGGGRRAHLPRAGDRAGRGIRPRGAVRARSHCRFVLPLIHFIPDSLTCSVPLLF